MAYMRTGAGRVEEILGEVDAWLSKLDPDDLAAVPLGGMAPLVRQVTALANRLDALRVDTVGAVDRSGAPSYDGLRTASWVTHTTRGRRQQARTDLHHAHTLRHLPATAAAFRSGRIGQAHVGPMAALHRGRLAPLLERDEWFLVATAEACPYDQFIHVLNRWRLAADPDGPEPAAEQRSFRLRPTVNAMFDGTLRTDNLTGAELVELLERAEKQEWEADWAEARRLHGAGATEADLPRSQDQRMHDALVALLRRGSAHPGGAEPRPVLNVVITEDRLAEILEEAAGVPGPPVDPVAAAGRDDVRLGDGTPLSGDDVIRLAVRGFVRRVVVDPGGQPVGGQQPPTPLHRPTPRRPPEPRAHLPLPRLRRPRPPLRDRPHHPLANRPGNHGGQRLAPVRSPPETQGTGVHPPPMSRRHHPLDPPGWHPSRMSTIHSSDSVGHRPHGNSSARDPPSDTRLS